MLQKNEIFIIKYKERGIKTSFLKNYAINNQIFCNFAKINK